MVGSVLMKTVMRLIPLYVLLLASSISAFSADNDPRLNVLLIIADDLNNDLGTYGHPTVKTPNIDALARNGVRFDAAYSQFPVCTPSRSSFLTGLYPEQIGVVEVEPYFRDHVPDVTTLPQLFRENGYSSARVGKIFHQGVPSQIGMDGVDDPPSWDTVVNPKGLDKDVEARVNSVSPTAPPGDIGGTLTWLSVDSQDEAHTDGIATTTAIKLMHELHPDKTGKPLFLAVGYYRPHVPLIAPSKYFDMYPLEEIELAAAPADDRVDIPVPALADRPYQAEMTEDQKKQVIQAYYASVSFIDAQVGRLLKELDRQGLTKSTVVVFMSDHGFHLGSHGLWQKTDLFEGSVRLPLILSVPGHANRGAATSSIAELVDLYPTLAELAALETPAYVEGRSLVPILDDPLTEIRDSAFTMASSRAWWTRPEWKYREITGYTIRTSRYRYTEWGDGAFGVEFYDYQNDPGELHNLAHDRSMASTRFRLARMLRDRREAARRRPQ
jgi:arylsulfatase A-like enzyme